MNRLFGVARRRPNYIDVLTPFAYGVDGYRLKWSPNFDGTFATLFTSTNVGYADPTINPYVIDAQPLGGFTGLAGSGRNVRIVFNPSNPSYGVALAGTFNAINGNAVVASTSSQVGVVYPGSSVTFASQAGVTYIVASVASGNITLTTNYGGTTNAATTATMTVTDTSSFWLQFAQVTGASETLVGAPTLVLPDAANHGVGIVTIHGSAPNVASSASSLQLDLPRLMEDFHIHNEDGSNNLFFATEQNGPETQLKPDTFSQFVQLRGTQSSIWVRGGGGIVAFSATFTLAYPR